MLQGLGKIGQFEDLYAVIHDHLVRTRQLNIVPHIAGQHQVIRREGDKWALEASFTAPTITQAVAWALDQPMVEKEADDSLLSP